MSSGFNAPETSSMGRWSTSRRIARRQGRMAFEGQAMLPEGFAERRSVTADHSLHDAAGFRLTALALRLAASATPAGAGRSATLVAALADWVKRAGHARPRPSPAWRRFNATRAACVPLRRAADDA
jgi:hypothetical protein